MKYPKKIFSFAVKNYLIVFFIAVVLFVFFISLFKTSSKKQKYIYVKMKMNQGLWWASTAKPPIWFTQAIKKGESEKGLLGKPVAEILNARFYPTKSDNVYDLRHDIYYDIYITLQLSVDIGNNEKQYSFKRNNLAVGSPIEINLPSTQVSGTIIDVNQQPFEEKFVDKIIYLIGEKFTQNTSSYLFDTIRIGDSYFDGEQTVFEILEKSYNNQSIVIKAKIKVRKYGQYFLYGEEYKLAANSYIPFSTPNFAFTDFVIGKIE